MQEIAGQIEQAVTEIRTRWRRRPRAGIILGTGLGDLAEQMYTEASIPFARIPHFPRATAASHKGQLVCGMLAGVPVATMAGRLHAYEGYSLKTTTFPVRVLARLGSQLLIVSNASGGLNPNFHRGDIVVIQDHINLMGTNPLIGAHDSSPGLGRQNGTAMYDPALVKRALQIARRADFVAHRGIYAAVRGPNYETRAEYRFLRRIGADLVGMSTVPEVIVAARTGLRVLALSTVTNVCRPDALRPTRSEEVVGAAERAAPNMQKIVAGILADEAGRG